MVMRMAVVEQVNLNNAQKVLRVLLFTKVIDWQTRVLLLESVV